MLQGPSHLPHFSLSGHQFGSTKSASPTCLPALSHQLPHWLGHLLAFTEPSPPFRHHPVASSPTAATHSLLRSHVCSPASVWMTSLWLNSRDPFPGSGPDLPLSQLVRPPTGSSLSSRPNSTLAQFGFGSPHYSLTLLKRNPDLALLDQLEPLNLHDLRQGYISLKLNSLMKITPQSPRLSSKTLCQSTTPVSLCLYFPFDKWVLIRHNNDV